MTGLVASLSAFGVVMVLASSSVISAARGGTPWSLAEHQAMWAVIGALLFVVATQVSMARLRKLSGLALVASAGLLLAVLLPGIGKGSGGASRWIGFGSITLQPSEVMKLAFAFFAADLVARRGDSDDPWRQIVRPVGIVLAVVDILIVAQPDLGSAIVVACVALGVLYAGGVPRRLLAGATLVAGVVGGGLALEAPYRRARLLSFINPFQHASGSGYQVVQSLLAIGSGHLTGAGLGSSPATWGLLPNAQTDFVFAVIGNDLGLVGTLAVVVAFVTLGWLGLRIAGRAADRFCSLLAAGITCLIVAEALINIGGVTGMLPETGIPLPFFSLGGSSLVVSLIACGLLVNIARHPDASSVTGAPARAARRAVPSTDPADQADSAARQRPVAPARGRRPGADRQRPVAPARGRRPGGLGQAPAPARVPPRARQGSGDAGRRWPGVAQPARRGREAPPRDQEAPPRSRGRAGDLLGSA